MNSPIKINYELRPCKYAERKMLLFALQRICHYYHSDYQYIGFGGLSFTDFKLFHKELQIDSMHSIEGGDNMNTTRLVFNRPYSFIQIHKGKSTDVLSKIDLGKKTVVWLDYDGALDNYMFEDLSLLMRQLPIGSVYLFTCNRELKNEDLEEYTVEQFKGKFGNLIPFEVSSKDFNGTNNNQTIRKMLQRNIDSIMSERKATGENVIFQQLFNILYQENRGARMFTYGGVITDIGTNADDFNIEDFPFVCCDEKSYKINVPNLTFKEELYISQKIPDNIEDLKNENIFEKKDIDNYVETYKFLPNYLDVRI